MAGSPFDKRIDELKAEIAVRNLKLNGLRQQRVEYHCPFEVGDILVDQNGKKASLDKITPGYSDDSYHLQAHYFKKDGALKQLVHRLYDWDDWKKVKDDQD